MNQIERGNKLIIGIVCGILLMLPAADAAQVVLVANSTGNDGQSGRLIGENQYALGVTDAQWTTRNALLSTNLDAMSFDDITYYARTGTTSLDAIININFTLGNVESVNYVYVTQIGSTTTNPEYNVLGLYNKTQANWTKVNVSNPPVGTYVDVTYNISSAEDKSKYLILSGNSLTFRVAVWTNGTNNAGLSSDFFSAIIDYDQATITPPTPSFLPTTQGNFWINYTWLPGSVPITDSYNVSVNNFWTNGTTQTFNLSNVGAHGWSNITVFAFNNSGGGSLSSTPATSNTQVANNVPVQTLADTRAITAGNMLTFTVSATDADSDTLTFSTNATGGTLNQSTGVYSWMPSSTDSGPHFWSFSSNDGYGGIAANTTTITVTDTSGTYINGTVRSGGTGVEGVTVSTNTTISTRTDASGFYSLPVTAGAYELTASLEPVYYTNSSVTAVVETGVVVQDIELSIKPTGTISGSVRNA